MQMKIAPIVPRALRKGRKKERKNRHINFILTLHMVLMYFK